MPDLTTADYKRITDLFEQEKWHFAKSMLKTPHHYTRKREWSSQEDFEWAVELIDDFGKVQQWYYTSFTYLYLGEFKYWCTGTPTEGIILINRATA